MVIDKMQQSASISDANLILFDKIQIFRLSILSHMIQNCSQKNYFNGTELN